MYANIQGSDVFSMALSLTAIYQKQGAIDD